jgi:hypothetical protein
MGKAARNKKNSKRTNAKRLGELNFEGFTPEESAQIESNRRQIWAGATDCKRLRLLIGAHPEEISEARGELIVEDFHAGRVDYDSAVAAILREVATPMLEPHFVLCDEQRLIGWLDPVPFLYEYSDPAPSTSDDAVDGAGYLLVMAHTFFSEECFLKYRATIFLTVDRIMARATAVQGLLNSGETTWHEVHGQYCRQSHRGTIAA